MAEPYSPRVVVLEDDFGEKALAKIRLKKAGCDSPVFVSSLRELETELQENGPADYYFLDSRVPIEAGEPTIGTMGEYPERVKDSHSLVLKYHPTERQFHTYCTTSFATVSVIDYCKERGIELIGKGEIAGKFSGEK